MLWRRVHHYAVSFKVRAELLCELARAQHHGFPLPKDIRRRTWKEPQSFDDFIRFLRVLDPRKKIEVLDVGANVGNWAAECLEFFPDSKITCFEPVPKTYEILRQRFAKEPRITPIDAGVSNAAGAAQMIVDESSERASLHEYGESQQDLNIQFTEKASVNLIRLDSLSLDPAADFRLLKVDVQGHEVAALEGAAGILPKIDVLIVECSFNLEYKDLKPSFSTVCHLAEQANLRPFHFRNYGRTLSPYAWERDVIFVQHRHLQHIWGW